MHLALMGLAAFNLVCSGSNVSGTAKDATFTSKQERAFTTVYRVDLSAKRWCSDTCLSTRALAELSSAAITFQSDEIEDNRLFDTVAVFDRETGAYIRRLKVGSAVDLDTGKCKIARFEGFPKSAALAKVERRN